MTAAYGVRAVVSRCQRCWSAYRHYDGDRLRYCTRQCKWWADSERQRMWREEQKSLRMRELASTPLHEMYPRMLDVLERVAQQRPSWADWRLGSEMSTERLTDAELNEFFERLDDGWPSEWTERAITELRELRAEVERLRATNDQWLQDTEELRTAHKEALYEKIARLEAENARLRAFTETADHSYGPDGAPCLAYMAGFPCICGKDAALADRRAETTL